MVQFSISNNLFMRNDFFLQKRLECNYVIPQLMLMGLLLFFSNLGFAQTCTTVIGGTAAVTSATICVGSSSTINVSGATTGTNVTYQWQESRLTTATTFTDIVGATAASYTFTAGSNDFGLKYYRRKTTCSGITGVSTTPSITVNNVSFNLNIANSNPTPCPGASSNLSATSVPTTIITTSSKIPLTVSGSNGQLDYPSPYANEREASRQQLIFLASELTSAGLVQGNLWALRFKTTSIAGMTTIKDYKISIGATNLTSFTSPISFQSGLTNVFSTPSYSPLLGDNTHYFTTPFYWNGTSNIIIEICSNNNIDMTAGNDVTRNAAAEFSNTGSIPRCIHSFADYPNATVGAGSCITVTPVASALNGIYRRPNVVLIGNKNAPPTWSWSTGVTTASITVTPTVNTTYTATATASGCSSSASSSVNLNIVNASSAITTPISCSSGQATITVSATGGTPPYVGVGTFNAGAGTHTYTVTDALGCAKSTTITVSQPSGLAFTGTTNDVLCYGDLTGEMDLSVSGGVAPYEVEWTCSNGTSSAFSPLLTGTPISNLAAGAYSVSIKDANGCISTDSLTILEPASPISITNISTVGTSCAPANTGYISNGEVIIIASGGTGTLEYSIDGNNYQSSEIFQNLDPDSYTAFVKDANGCITTQNFVISSPAQIIGVLDVVNDVTCNGANDGSVIFSSVGGSGSYDYALYSIGGINIASSQNIGSFNSLVPDDYYITITDANGCSTEITGITISEPVAVAVSTNIVHVSCFGGNNGQMNVVVSGGLPTYQYDLSTLSGTTLVSYQANDYFDNLTAGAYVVSVQDGNGCIVTDSVVVDEPTQITATVANTNVSCNGGNNATITINNATGGTGTLSFNNNGSSYQSLPTFSNLLVGVYVVGIQDLNYCVRTYNVTITQPAPLAVTAGTVNASCAAASNGQITATLATANTPATGATGGTAPYQYSLNGTTQVATSIPWAFTGLMAGTYTVTVADANGCTASVSKMVVANTGIVTPIPNFTYVINGNTITFTNTTTCATSYTWAFGNGTTSNATNASCTYTIGSGTSPYGPYNVVLTARNGTLTATKSVSFSIIKGRTLNIATTGTQRVAGVTMTLNYTKPTGDNSVVPRTYSTPYPATGCTGCISPTASPIPNTSANANYYFLVPSSSTGASNYTVSATKNAVSGFNNAVDILDQDVMNAFVPACTTTLSIFQRQAADLNRDGVIDILDKNYLLAVINTGFGTCTICPNWITMVTAPPATTLCVVPAATSNVFAPTALISAAVTQDFRVLKMGDLVFNHAVGRTKNSGTDGDAYPVQLTEFKQGNEYVVRIKGNQQLAANEGKLTLMYNHKDLSFIGIDTRDIHAENVRPYSAVGGVLEVYFDMNSEYLTLEKGEEWFDIRFNIENPDYKANIQLYSEDLGSSELHGMDNLVHNLEVSHKVITEPEITIYPNPTSNGITISYLGNEINSLELFSLDGRLIRNVKVNENETQEDLSDLSAGVYLLRVNGQFVHKVVKQ